jgi:hypothetical protein
MESPEGAAPATSDQRSCMGMLYLQHAMGRAPKQPVCVGVSQAQKSPAHIEDRTQVTGETPNFKVRLQC